jgi:hypothetical protein
MRSLPTGTKALPTRGGKEPAGTVIADHVIVKRLNPLVSVLSLC